MGHAQLRPDELEVEELEAMLFELDYVNTVQFLQGCLSRMLKQSALEAARREGRKLLTGDDVLEALDRLGLSKIYPPDSEETQVGDGH
jgi:hypothetical protein